MINSMPPYKYKEKGSTLVVTLILLVILTVLGIREVSFNSMLTRIATNSADALVAYISTEGALNQGVTQIISGIYPVDKFATGMNGLSRFDPTAAPLWTTINWNSNTAVIQSYQGNSNIRAAYFIELLPAVTPPGQTMKKPSSVYRITARGVGASGGAPVILQAVVIVPNN